MQSFLQIINMLLSGLMRVNVICDNLIDHKLIFRFKKINLHIAEK